MPPRIHPAFASVLFLAGCAIVAPPTPVFVNRTPTGDRAPREEGPSVTVHHADLRLGGDALKKGFFVIKTEADWRALFPKADDDKVPPFPPEVDLSREMLLVTVPSADETLASSVETVIDTEHRGLHVYVVEIVAGQDCPPRSPDSDKPNFGVVHVPRMDGKNVRFHVESIRAPACGEGPEASVACRSNGTTTPFSPKLSVSPGTAVACVAEGPSARPTLDRTWTFASTPSGAMAKMTVSERSAGIAFVPVVIGTYKLSLEVADDLDRKRTVTTDIEVWPPKEAFTVQMVWTKFAPTDAPDTFPRVELHAIGTKKAAQGNAPSASVSTAASATAATPHATSPPLSVPAKAMKWGQARDCVVGLGQPPPWCVAKVVGTTTLMTLDPATAEAFAMAVHYTDERMGGAPVLCVRVYRGGAMTSELCDSADRVEDAWWEAGVVDSQM